MARLSETSLWVKTKSDEEAVRRGCYFDLAAAQRVRDFIEKFFVGTTGDWAGKPFELIDWQWNGLIAPLYGWKQKDGRRRFDRFGVGIPKKNGKSTLVSILCIYALVADREANAEVYLCSSSKEQAKIVYREAAKFIDASPELASVIRRRDYWGKLESKIDSSFLLTLAAENKGKHGFNSHFTLFDEFHEQRDWELWNTLRYAGRSRSQPILGWISTAGFDPDRPWLSEWQYARDVLSGSMIDVGFLPLIYEAAPDADYSDPKVWAAANPSLGKTFRLSTMEGDFTEAKNKGSVALRDFRILQLNQVIKEGVSYISRDDWDRLGKPGTTVGKNGYAALDLASTRDINALVFGDVVDGKLRHESYFWCPEETNKKEQANASRYRAWTDAGHLRRTPGSYIDWEVLSKDIIALLAAKKPKKILVDPYNASQLITLLAQAGYKVEAFTQSFRNYNSPTRELERLVGMGLVEHSANPVMSWMIGNTNLATNKDGHVMPDRSKDRLRKIDGVPATLMMLAELTKEINSKTKRFTSW